MGGSAFGSGLDVQALQSGDFKLGKVSVIGEGEFGVVWEGMCELVQTAIVWALVEKPSVIDREFGLVGEGMHGLHT